MAHDFLKLFDRWHFSDYEPELAFGLTCPSCGDRHNIHAGWSEVHEGYGGNEAPAKNAKSPWLVRRYLEFTCPSCEIPLTLYLSGAAGGRQAEIQYGLAGLRYDGKTLT